jgi:hypothetical protein
MDFLVGHPRSGTMLASHLFNACQPGASDHEFLYRMTSDMVWASSEFQAGRLDAVAARRLLEHYHRPVDYLPNVRIDCNWKLSFLLPVLLEVFPEARIVHLTREPLANIRSCLDLDYYGTLWSDPRSQANHRRNYFLHWMPRFAVPGWDAMSQLEKNCVFWRETHRAILSAVSESRRVLWRLEDLMDDRVLAGVLDFLGLPWPGDDKLATVRASKVNVKGDEKAEVASLRTVAPIPIAETVERICGAVAREFGYGQQS